MNTGDALATILRALGEPSPATITATGTDSAPPLPLSPGQRVTAEVIAHLAGQGYLVRVAGTELQMQLPSELSPGNRLELVFLTQSPRPTFAFPAAGEETSVSLSATARLLGTLASDPGPPDALSPLPRPTTFFPAPQAAAPAIAERLRTILTQSGLFYEAHLARAAAGELSVEALLKEPQVSLGKTPPVDPIDPHSVPLVREQLQTLATGLFAWRGELWPGQAMEWTVREREPEGEDAEAKQGWETTLCVDLPILGTVRATLRLAGTHVRIGLLATEQATAPTLAGHAGELAAALAASGLALTDLTVRHG